MFTTLGVRTLYEETHNRIDLLLEHARSLPPQQFTQSVPGFGSSSVRDQLVHILSVEAAWVNASRNRPVVRLTETDYPDVMAITRLKHEVMTETLRYLKFLDDTTLNQRLTVVSPEWNGPLRSPGFIMHHIITHAFHHKGQVASMFRILGHPIGDTDLQQGE